MGRVSVYIPSHNGERYIAKTIESILKQTYPVEEVIIVDDGSTDKTDEIVSKYPVRLIRHQRNKGIAATRNTAVREIRADFIASLDADCLAGPTWLQECMKNFIKADIAAVGGRLIENDEDTVYKWRAIHLKHHWGTKRKINPIFLSGSNITIRKDVFDKVGRYNEKKFKKNYEDVDLSLRLKRKGFTLIYEPNATAMHLKKDTLVSILKTYWSWQFYDYKPKYISRLIFNFINVVKLISEDAIEGNLDLIPIDILAFPFTVYFDFRNLLKKDL